MVIQSSTRTECVCSKCGHSWRSHVKSPQQCPVCKRKDWTGLHNSTGRLLGVERVQGCKCAVCGHSWNPRVADPAQCPACKRYNWREVAGAGGSGGSGGSGGRVKGERYIVRTCEACLSVFEDDTRGKLAGMCGRCGWVGAYPNGGYKKSYGPMPEIESLRAMVRRAQGGDLSPDGSYSPDGPIEFVQLKNGFDPDGVLG